MRNVIVAIALSAALACAHGHQFSFEDTKKLTPGVSTRVDAERLFGPPASVSSSSDGSVVCGWSYSHAGFMGSNVGSKVLLITFRPDGTYDRASETTSGADAKTTGAKR